jgi:hypothetical protein
MTPTMPHPTARPGLRALAACALAAAGIASAARAETITVCLDGSCDFTDPVAAVEAAVAGDTVTIASGTYPLSGPLSLYGKNLVIRGAVDAGGRPVTVLDGRNATYHLNALHVSAATVIENLVLTNGRSTQFGAVYMFGCAGTTLRNCSVRGNHGGAVGLNGSSVTMIGCEILDNAGGSGTSAGGGIYVSGAISLVDCVVSGNTATFSGGGIFLPSGGIANLTRTRVCGNSAPQGAQIGQNPGGTVNDLGGACISVQCGDCQPTPPCPADLNGDDSVNGTDLGALLGAWGTAGPADLNSDGTVNGADLGQLVGAWGTCG